MKTKIISASVVVGIMWLIFIADYIIPGNFNNMGITPRTLKGLLGIVFAPFLHDGIYHIVSNTIPIFVLTLVLGIFYERIALRVWVLSALIGGAMVWLLSFRDATHVGASGVIFSLIGFIMASGIFRKSFKSIIIGIIIFFFYGGSLWGILPTNPWISWEGHLFGLVAGIFLAYIFRKEETSFSTKEKFD